MNTYYHSQNGYNSQNNVNRISLANWKNEDRMSVRTIKSRYTIQQEPIQYRNNNFVEKKVSENEGNYRSFFPVRR